jgi:hypothetical protein
MALALRAGFAVRAARGAVRQRKLPAQSAEALQLLFDGYRYAQPILLTAIDCRTSQQMQFGASLMAGWNPPYKSDKADPSLRSG